MMDELIENPKSSNGFHRAGANKKRGNVGRRSKKQSDLPIPSSDDNHNDLQWWRGGKLSKIILQTGTIPRSLAKKAARQGGRKIISGISYHECSEHRRRSQQFAWRAAVEMSKSTSQLALQVRYLDAHIRWKEFIRPEPTQMDNIKGSKTDAVVFRNVSISDKRFLENKILYALNFGDQKYLPSRIAKTVLESEKTEDGNHKLWFNEDHLPLYLIKEYEEKVGICQVPAVSTLNNMTKFYRRELKFYWGDVFTYLVCKRENPINCSSCQKDVCLRYAVKCKVCEDYCHLDCSVPSVLKQEDGSEFSRLCKLCYSAKARAVIESSQRACSMKFSFAGNHQLQSVPCGTPQKKPGGTKRTRRSVSKTKRSGGAGLTDGSTRRSESKTKRSGGAWFTHGIVWKQKKHGSEEGKKFRMENILLKSKEGSYSSKNPICCLCKLPYNSNLMYVCCETCKRWCHADAVLLDETKIPDVVSFKCCKCRRKSSPDCPYSVIGYTELEELLKHENAVEISDAMQIPPISGSSTTSISDSETDNFDMVEFDPLHYFEDVDDETIEMEEKFDASIQSFKGQQKLSVQSSQVKQEDFDECYAAQIGEPLHETCLQSLQNMPAASPMSASWNLPAALEWDSAEFDDHVGLNFNNIYKEEHLPDEELDMVRRSQVKQEDLDECYAVEAPLQSPLSIPAGSASWKLPAALEWDSAELDGHGDLNFKNMYKVEHLPDSAQVKQQDFDECYAAPSSQDIPPVIASWKLLEWDSAELDGHVDLNFGNMYKEERSPDQEIDMAADLVRRSHVKQEDFDECFAAQIGDPSLQCESAELDRNGNLKSIYKEERLPDQEHGMAGDMVFEPQTYFSFTELLASEDDDMPIAVTQHPTLNGYGAAYSDRSCIPPPTVSDEFSVDGFKCQKCKADTPSPDLICEICKICIHSHCSPWVEESIENSAASKWRCGNCREWR